MTSPAHVDKSSVKGLLIALSVIGLLSLISLFIGATTTSPVSLFAGNTTSTISILLASRIPRTLALLLAGSSMAVAGLIMQMLSRNRFVEPGTAGTIESATLGLLLAALLAPGLPVLARMLVACCTALLGTLLFLVILRLSPMRSPLMVPLVGLMLGGVINAMATFLAYRFDLIQSLVAWSTGDFSSVLRGRYELLWISFGAAVLAYIAADRFTVAGLGQNFANNLGLNYRLTLITGLVIVSIVTAAVVATVGAIPFVGLVVPNIISMMIGDNLRRSVPWTATLGAGFVLSCDILGRSVNQPFEIPVGPIIGIAGSVIFLFILKRGAARFD
ncbi:iron chelate uptake ABC transporter family permease subunit [Pantoea allii]|uniref:Iron chelate uptake ABC transporter family permease subunit n=1 Tax=Pantoea allii TaxID=574096 RepID=A0A2V2BGY7_9GAMM|nr:MULTISPECIES: iron chelate uptake ABC transporter family permease subunit [Pantoea]MBW1214702.1 iron chelate uptake ABC transporter family permease subunit [Pantoea allii]MBW1252688.1 iron chelate uptake ABC transporter family permease subunit [Pantoea allii]MBW1258333.1 iron chelate uptake ABC transporter family permease subunit [Pantoea allii]MBW1262035.1 iron chelate uptake ABC transporter family permease subunit [Pantoea allii]MBW1267554.1 iron chelate uptake ABC transporter family perm